MLLSWAKLKSQFPYVWLCFREPRDSAMSFCALANALADARVRSDWSEVRGQRDQERGGAEAKSKLFTARSTSSFNTSSPVQCVRWSRGVYYSDGVNMQHAFCTEWCSVRDPLQSSECCMDAIGVAAALVPSILLAGIANLLRPNKKIRYLLC